MNSRNIINAVLITSIGLGALSACSDDAIREVKVDSGGNPTSVPSATTALDPHTGSLNADYLGIDGS